MKPQFLNYFLNYAREKTGYNDLTWRMFASAISFMGIKPIENNLRPDKKQYRPNEIYNVLNTESKLERLKEIIYNLKTDNYAALYARPIPTHNVSVPGLSHAEPRPKTKEEIQAEIDWEEFKKEDEARRLRALRKQREMERASQELIDADN